MRMNLPKTIYSGEWDTSHIQGIAIDTERQFIYYSFTTILVKTDLNGNLIGTVSGLTGHLGCLDFNDDDGRVYGSLEYKPQNAFYIAIFDVKKIDRVGLDAEKDGIMTTVYMKEVVKDFTCENPKYRYGCSGIDGVSFGPPFGSLKGTPNKFMVAYGIFQDTTRDDNDNQIILQFDISDWSSYERTLNQSAPHESGPEMPEHKYFLYTGNTTYGIQNLEYDAYTGNWFVPVYNGTKPQYPNYPMYVIDGSKSPDNEKLSLLKSGLYHEPSGIYGWSFPWGQTGLFSLDNGYYYISHNGTSASGKQTGTIHLYRYDDKELFKPAD